MVKRYIKLKLEIIKVSNNILLAQSWNKVGNFGPGDEEDDDREGDDNWDKDWTWNN